jgi:acyl-CoA synthetase (AMP-forming)/AMP-acid ligase II
MSSYSQDIGPMCSSLMVSLGGLSSACGQSIYTPFNHLTSNDQCYCRLSGMTYVDVLHIYGLSRAGYIPQLFSIRLPNPDVVYELLSRANACALLVDPSFEGLLKSCPIPTHRAATTVYDIDSHDMPLPSLPTLRERDTVFIFHTSGSTSGIPKLVPCSSSWLDSAITKSHQIAMPSGRTKRNQDVTVWM